MRNSKTRVLIIVDGLRSGGKERRLVELLRNSKNAGIHYHLIIYNSDIYYTEIFDLGLEISVIEKDVLSSISILIRSINKTVSFKPDCIHTWDIYSSFIGVFCSLFVGKPLIAGHITTAPKNAIKSYGILPYAMSKISFVFAKLVIGNSNAGLKSFDAPFKKSKVIYNGYNFDRLAKLVPGISDNLVLGCTSKFIVCMIASFEKTKDYGTFLKVAERMTSMRDDVIFLAVGGGTMLKNFKQHYSNNPNIVFLGKRSDVESIIMQCNLGILLTNSSNHGEGISNSLLEFMAAGKPVVATRGGGTIELVRDGIDGFLVTDGNPQEVVGVIERFLADPELGFHLGQNATDRIKRNFSIEIMTDKYFEMYKEITQ